MPLVSAHAVPVVHAVPNLNVNALHSITLLMRPLPWLLGWLAVWREICLDMLCTLSPFGSNLLEPGCKTSDMTDPAFEAVFPGSEDLGHLKSERKERKR